MLYSNSSLTIMDLVLVPGVGPNSLGAAFVQSLASQVQLS